MTNRTQRSTGVGQAASAGAPNAGPLIRALPAERLTPNFVLLWQSDDADFIHPVIPTSRSGGLRIRGEERAWEMVGLYHDEDEAFKAFETWQPGDDRGSGQLVISQISDLAYTTAPNPEEH